MTRNILVIDDDELILGTLKRLLRGEGYGVSTAQSGQEAIEKIKNVNYNLIITDIRMPGLDGVETIKQIRKSLSELGKDHIPELVITGYDSEDNRQKTGDLKVAGFLTKPFDLKELLSNIEAHIKNE
ncbi:response regulator [Candidatus Omnitrophota bacterium]